MHVELVATYQSLKIDKGLGNEDIELELDSLEAVNWLGMEMF